MKQMLSKMFRFVTDLSCWIIQQTFFRNVQTKITSGLFWSEALNFTKPGLNKSLWNGGSYVWSNFSLRILQKTLLSHEESRGFSREKSFSHKSSHDSYDSSLGPHRGSRESSHAQSPGFQGALVVVVASPLTAVTRSSLEPQRGSRESSHGSYDGSLGTHRGSRESSHGSQHSTRSSSREVWYKCMYDCEIAGIYTLDLEAMFLCRVQWHYINFMYAINHFIFKTFDSVKNCQVSTSNYKFHFHSAYCPLKLY